MIRALLLDVDGVLTIDGQPVAGAAEAVEHLTASGIPFRVLTNSTVRSRRQVAERLARVRIPVPEESILTPARAARLRLERLGNPSVIVFAKPELRSDLAGANIVDAGPAEIVLLGDLGERFDYPLLQGIFERIEAGARLWALHKSAYWFQGGKIRLDLGAFVAALEFATGRPAEILGKPSPEAFLEAARDLGCEPRDVAMVGDDVRSDVGAARTVGMTGLLVRTGKYREDLVAESGVRPDAVLDSIAALPAWLSANR